MIYTYLIPSAAGVLFVTALTFYYLGHADGYSKATNLWRKK
jgi:hypothetical protein